MAIAVASVLGLTDLEMWHLVRCLVLIAVLLGSNLLRRKKQARLIVRFGCPAVVVIRRRFELEGNRCLLGGLEMVPPVVSPPMVLLVVAIRPRAASLHLMVVSHEDRDSTKSSRPDRRASSDRRA